MKRNFILDLQLNLLEIERGILIDEMVNNKYILDISDKDTK